MTQELRLSDPHTYHEIGQPVPDHHDLDVDVSFDKRTLSIRQTTRFDKPGLVYCDMDGQAITKVSASDGVDLPYEVGERHPDFGSRFAVTVPENLIVVIELVTAPDAKGVQWVTPEQADSRLPVMYTQFESIAARSVLITPDSPSIRFTWSARVTVPKEMRAVLAADVHVSREEFMTLACERYEMHTRVPSYLVALNVGEFEYRAFDERSGVFANPAVIDQAYAALKRTPDIIAGAEKLFGPYLWHKYDTIVLPKRGYPFGAMEHPTLTSMNAMLIEDPALAEHVTCHELMHSWYGNLITNGSWEDFWLNEGVTTFAEWQIIGEVLGDEERLLRMALVREELIELVADMKSHGDGQLTCLKTNLTGINPDATFGRIPYYKGAFFLKTLEERFGRERMLEFQNEYIAAYRYTSIRTHEFIKFASERLHWDGAEFANAQAWIYTPGLPSNLPTVVSETANSIMRYAKDGIIPLNGSAANWKLNHWVLYLANLSRSVKASVLDNLDALYGFSTSPIGVLKYEFARAALENTNVPTSRFLDSARSVLLTYGRTLVILPLYKALIARGRLDDAKSIFAEARPGYHPMGQERVEEVFRKHEAQAA
jgi:aminopeptidase N